jgi:DNA recombination protein RmuC
MILQNLPVEYWAIAAGLALLFAVMAYWLASVRSSKALTLAQRELALAQAETQQRLEQHNSLSSQLEAARNALQTARLALQTSETRLESTAARKEELEQRLLQLEKALEVLREEKHTAEKTRQSVQTELQESRKQQVEIREQYKALEQKNDALQQRFTTLSSEQAQLQTSLAERDDSYKKQLAHFEGQKKALGEEFKVLANEILDQKSKALQESSSTNLSALMAPFKQSIDTFKKEVQDIHHRETTQRSELHNELKHLQDLNQKITTEAHELSTALRGQKKLQGNWGEMVLESVLDSSGLQQGRDYEREKSFNTEDGRQRPDVIVNLPQGKHLIIDAKVSLNAYTRYVNSEGEAERQLALREHVRAVGDRIKELADRDYYKINELNSPEMVFLFIPIESAFVEALKADETLFQMAIENNVLVATPTTLLTSLNIVRQLWRYEDQNKHTAALAAKAESVFKKLNGFLASFEDVRKGLEKASAAYGKAENQLISGKGNLVKQVGEFKNLAPAIKAELPGYFAEKADLEIDYIPSDKQSGRRNDNSPQAGESGESEAVAKVISAEVER